MARIATLNPPQPQLGRTIETALGPVSWFERQFTPLLDIDLRSLPEFRESANRDTLDAVTVLLEAGADANVTDPNQETALHIAAKALHPGIVRALVAHGAVLDAEDKDGLTPLQAVEKMEAPKPTPGFFFQPPLAQPAEMVGLLQELSGDHAE